MFIPRLNLFHQFFPYLPWKANHLIFPIYINFENWIIHKFCKLSRLSPDLFYFFSSHLRKRKAPVTSITGLCCPNSSFRYPRKIRVKLGPRDKAKRAIIACFFFSLWNKRVSSWNLIFLMNISIFWALTPMTSSLSPPVALTPENGFSLVATGSHMTRRRREILSSKDGPFSRI